MRKEALKKELREVMLWGGEETPEYWLKEVEDKGYPAVLRSLKERVSEWRAVNKYEDNITEEAKFIARMEWEEIEKLAEEVFFEVLKEAETE